MSFHPRFHSVLLPVLQDVVRQYVSFEDRMVLARASPLEERVLFNDYARMRQHIFPGCDVPLHSFVFIYVDNASRDCVKFCVKEGYDYDDTWCVRNFLDWWRVLYPHHVSEDYPIFINHKHLILHAFPPTIIPFEDLGEEVRSTRLRETEVWYDYGEPDKNEPDAPTWEYQLVGGRKGNENCRVTMQVNPVTGSAYMRLEHVGHYVD